MAITIKRTTALDGPIIPESMAGSLFTGEKLAHQFIISCTRDGAAISLSGSVTGRFMRADGQTILLTGSVSSGKGTLTLPQDCYNINGRFVMALFNVAGGATTTIYAATGNVLRTQGGTIIDSGSAVPNIDDLLAQIDAMEQATARANAAADKAVRYDAAQELTAAQQLTARNNISAARAGIIDIFAVAFDATKDYYAGDYCTYRGSLWRFTADHPAGAWKGDDPNPDNRDVTTVTVGNEINNTTVKVNKSQSLSGTNKAQARANIDAAAIGTIAVAFDPNRAEPYNPGDYCTYNGSLYRFTTTHTGAWNNSHVVAVTVGNEINTTTVKTNVSQNLTDDQKTRARNNIGAASAGDVDDLKSAMNSQNANIPIEIGINRSISNNLIVKSENTKRASTDVIAPSGSKFIITPKTGFSLNVFALLDNTTWTAVASAITATTEVSVGNATYFFVQVMSDTVISSDEIPFVINYNTANANTILHNDINDLSRIPITYEPQVNRSLTDTVIVVSANTKRGSIRPVKAFTDHVLVDVKGTYSWNLYTSDSETTGYSIIETGIRGAKDVEIGYGKYFFIAVRMQDETVVPLDDNPIIITASGLYKGLITANKNTENDIDTMSAYTQLGDSANVSLANGTIANPVNANAVNTSNYVPVVEDAQVKCVVTRPNTSGYYYAFAYAIYDANKDLLIQDTGARDYNQSIVVPHGGRFVKFAIFERDSAGNFSPLRTNNISSNDVNINIRVLTANGIVGLNTGKKAEAEILKLKKTDGENYGQCDARFLFMTDIHGDLFRTQRAVELVNAWSTPYIDCVINGGDTVELDLTESLDWYNNTVDKLLMPIINTVGNHDAWASLGVIETDPKVVYNAIIAPVAAKSNITQPSDASTNGYNYYYKDFNNAIRVIVLDCMYWDGTQLAWLESVLENAKTNGLAVVCVSHAAFNLTYMDNVDCLWSRIGEFYQGREATDPTRTNIQAAQAVKDFMDAGGSFVCWLVGHQHGDRLRKLTNYGNQFVVAMGSFAQRASTLQKSDIQTNYNYDCLTYIAVDNTNKICKLLRIGADIDMYGVKHNGLTFDYANNVLVSSW